jgi:hypothetical protein
MTGTMHLALPKQKKVPFMRADDRAIDRAIDDKFRMPLFVVFERQMVCAPSALGLGRSVVTCVNHGTLLLPEADIESAVVLEFPCTTEIKIDRIDRTLSKTSVS